MPEKYDEKKLEPEILAFWDTNKIYQKAKEKNKGKESYYFLEGPPYTSGRVHIGHAWNLSLKDCFVRYKRMQGFDVFDRWGYDMHGLPTEHATEKKLNLHGKKAIVEFGVAKFIQECEKLALENAKQMNVDFKRLGAWFDFENAYMPITQEYIEGEWWLIKQAHEKGRLYEGERTMTWCSSCATACAKHELEYKKIRDHSIFVKFKLKNNLKTKITSAKVSAKDNEKNLNNSENEYLIIWTTTPWTIPFNLAVMVHPEFDYVKCKVDNEIWIVAKTLANKVIAEHAEKGFEILEEIKGKKLEGLEYEPLFEEEIPQLTQWKKECPKAFTVLLSEEYVNLEDGTGIVHCAPGCGPEDYEVGHKNNIKPFNLLNEHGVYENAGALSNFTAKKEDKIFIEKIKEKNALVASSSIEHDYAHCQRCHDPIVFRTTVQWFFKVEDIKEQMIKENNKIKWVPQSAYNAFDSWLRNLRDNSITKQRFWGTPLPIWKCVCGKYEVFDTVAEIEKRSKKKFIHLHKPWIDEVTMQCSCGKQMRRIPDILDVWVDAGCASWNALDFPKRKDLFEKLFPADIIIEGIDQIRGWFNLLLIASMIAHNKPSFKAVYMHGFINDALGRKMSKSLSNYILPEEVVQQYGADTLRYYMIGGANPGLDLNYNFEDVKLKYRNLIVLWNLHNYLIELARQVETNPEKLDHKKMHKLFSTPEKYIFSKLHSTTRKLTELYEQYHMYQTPLVVEELFLELSRTYIQLVREKVASGADEEKELVLYTMYHTVITLLKLFSPTCPFICEAMYQNLKKEFKLKEESIHTCSWPTYDAHFINEDLEKQMRDVQDVIAAALYVREKAKWSVRWPLKSLIIATNVKHIQQAAKALASLLQTQVNVKEVQVVENFEACKTTIEPDMGKLGIAFTKDAKDVANALKQIKPEKLLISLDVDKKYELVIGKKKFEIVKDHVKVTQHVCEPYVMGPFKEGSVFLDLTRNDELDGEGFAREIMRRVQALRKSAGLVKQDSIKLHIKVDEQLEELLEGWHGHVKEKVGAKQFTLSQAEAPKLQHTTSELIKDHEFTIALEKL
ncbi:isoleucine--tRNA ligase [Candidatus Woesearchaeota archaeon]|nr:isoleucine--tRNA ligase [Candidatus Woesearchaeota archaeon]